MEKESLSIKKEAIWFINHKPIERCLKMQNSLNSRPNHYDSRQPEDSVIRANFKEAVIIREQ